MNKKKIVVFASGSGTNAENIVEYSRKHGSFEVVKIYCNKTQAGVIGRGYSLHVPVVVFDKELFYSTSRIVDDIKNEGADAVVLAGFLWLIPDNMLESFGGRIINIHPALLPKHGGKGMYGAKVHEAVHANRDKETGITIHHVNEVYDEGKTIFQASCPVTNEDTPETIAAKVHKLEYEHFPRVIAEFVNSL